MALTLVIIVSFRKFYLGILLKRKFLAKPRYATFQKNSLKIAHIYNQTMSWEGGCNLAPQAHSTLLFLSPCCMFPFATGPSFHLPGLWFLRYVFLWHFVFFSCCGGFLRHESCSKPVKRQKKKIFFLGPKRGFFFFFSITEDCPRPNANRWFVGSLLFIIFFIYPLVRRFTLKNGGFLGWGVLCLWYAVGTLVLEMWAPAPASSGGREIKRRTQQCILRPPPLGSRRRSVDETSSVGEVLISEDTESSVASVDVKEESEDGDCDGGGGDDGDLFQGLNDAPPCRH